MSDLVQKYMELDPNGEFFITLKKSRRKPSIPQPIVWSKKFNQPVREVTICGITFEKLLGSRANVPSRDPNYVFLASDIEPLRAALTLDANIAFSGPAGTGKTTCPEQLASVLNRPFFVFDFNEDSRPESLIGQYKAHKGNQLVWQDGPVTKALKAEGAFFLLDEAPLCPPSILGCMHRVLASRETTLHDHEGEVIKAQPGVVFMMACNGLNDENAAMTYVGNNQMNRAFLDRFKFTVKTSYPSGPEEVQIINKRIKSRFADDYAELIKPDCDIKNVIPKMVKAANKIRSAIQDGDLSLSFSIRKTLGWAESYAYFRDLSKATHYSIINMESQSDAKVLDTQIHEIFADEYTRYFEE